MLKAVPACVDPHGLLLLLDTCGDRASLALLRGATPVAQAELQERTASAALLSTLRRLLSGERASVRDLAAIGVVSGPGSFTGVRVGLAMAKGLCEALAIPMAAVSRLKVLADAAGLRSGVVLLSAGRDQVYALRREVDTADREWLSTLPQVLPLMVECRVVVGSAALRDRFADEAGIEILEPSAIHALPAVLQVLAKGGSDVASVDANYVRNEEAIYTAASKAKRIQNGEPER